MPTIVVGAVYAFYLAIAAREAAGRKRRQEMLAAAAGAMTQPTADFDAGTVTGVCAGLPTTFCLRGGVAHVEVAIPGVEILVALQSRLAPVGALNEPGTVETGDVAFAEAFDLEGAPVDVVTCLFSPDIRARLLALRPLVLTIDGSAVEVRASGALPAAEVPALVVAAAETAAAIPHAVSEADQRLTVVTGSPFRPSVDATAVHAAQSTRTAEMASLLTTMRERAIATRRALILAVVLGTILVVSLYASGN
jgi:hypothetical protein